MYKNEEDFVWGQKVKLGIIVFCLLVLGANKLFAETLVSPTPCFDVDIEVPRQHSLEVRGTHDNDSSIVVDRDWYVSKIKSSFCGVGDWVIESRTSTECLDIIDDKRIVTGDPCVWSDWATTVTATVSTSGIPQAPIFAVEIKIPPEPSG